LRKLKRPRAGSSNRQKNSFNHGSIWLQQCWIQLECNYTWMQAKPVSAKIDFIYIYVYISETTKGISTNILLSFLSLLGTLTTNKLQKRPSYPV
jgi:hypothetical protein